MSVANNIRITKTCRTCNKPFSLTAEKAERYARAGLLEPTHCSTCIKERKQRGKPNAK